MKKAMIKIIDYLIANGACDCCARCIHFKPIKEPGNFDPCLEVAKYGDVACRDGMIKFFRENTKER